MNILTTVASRAAVKALSEAELILWQTSLDRADRVRRAIEDARDGLELPDSTDFIKAAREAAAGE